MRFGKDSYNLLMKSSGIAKKAVLHAPQSSSRFFGFVFHASSFILPQTCSMMFMSGDWAGQSWSTLIFFALRNFDVEMEVCNGAPSCCKFDVAFHPADLSHTPILDVTPDHDFSATKLDCFLGESRIHVGSSRSPAIFAATVM